MTGGGTRCYGAYSPSKFAVRGLCEVWRQEYKPHGNTATGVHSPDVGTPMLSAEQKLKPPKLIARPNARRSRARWERLPDGKSYR